MNRVIKLYKGESSVDIVLHTDGEPDEFCWVWEVSKNAIEDWFGYRYGIEDFDEKTAEDFANDESILEDSDEYENGKAPIYGEWYAPLTMDQVEKTLG